MQVELIIHRDEQTVHTVWTLPDQKLSAGHLYAVLEGFIFESASPTVEEGISGEYDCPVCTDPERSFPTKQGLTMHLRRVHSKNGW